MLDVGMLKMEGTPDSNGKPFSPSVSEGSVSFKNAKPGTWMHLVIAGGTFDTATGTCGGTCIQCCGWNYASFQISPTGIDAYSAVQATLLYSLYGEDCSTPDQPVPVDSWTSTGTSVATIDSSGNLTGVAPGSDTLQAYSTVYGGPIVQACSDIGNPICPAGSHTTSGTAHVNQLASFKISVSSPSATGEGNSMISGQSANVKVTAIDNSGATMTDYSGTVHFSSTDSLASLPGDYTYTGADAGVHDFTVTLRTVSGQDPYTDLKVEDSSAQVDSTDLVNLWFEVTMDVERWMNCGDATCADDGSYCYKTACEPSGFASPTPFVAVTGSGLCGTGILVGANGGAPASTTIEDCGPSTCSNPYWNNGGTPSMGGCMSDQLATNLGVSNGCNGTAAYGAATVVWRFQ